MTLGVRLELLRRVVAVHAGQPDRVLGDLQGWWQAAQPAWNRLVEERNRNAHGGALAEEPPEQMRAELAQALRGATWLCDLQLVHLEGTTNRRQGRHESRVRLLRGPAPDSEAPLESKWRQSLDSDAIYMGNRDGTRWTAHPFLQLGDGLGALGRSVQVRDGMDFGRGNRLYFLDPVVDTGRPAEVAEVYDGDQALCWQA